MDSCSKARTSVEMDVSLVLWQDGSRNVWHRSNIDGGSMFRVWRWRYTSVERFDVGVDSVRHGRWVCYGSVVYSMVVYRERREDELIRE